MTKKLRFTIDDWDRIEKDTMLWWAGELDRPLVWLSVTDPVLPHKPFGKMSNYPTHMPVDEIVDQYEQVLIHTSYYADGFPWLWVDFGPGIVAGFLGAQVNSVTEPSETVWFSTSEKKPIELLHLNYDSENLWWKRVRGNHARSCRPLWVRTGCFTH
jgi:hypothetical protein